MGKGRSIVNAIKKSRIHLLLIGGATTLLLHYVLGTEEACETIMCFFWFYLFCGSWLVLLGKNYIERVVPDWKRDSSGYLDWHADYTDFDLTSVGLALSMLISVFVGKKVAYIAHFVILLVTLVIRFVCVAKKYVDITDY